MIADLVSDLEDAGCQARVRVPRQAGYAFIDVTGSPDAIRAGMSTFHSRSEAVQAFADEQHYSQGVVPGESHPRHAVDHQSGGEVTLCGVESFVLAPDRFRMYDPDSCDACQAEAERRRSS
jgi:hypothetical protein